MLLIVPERAAFCVKPKYDCLKLAHMFHVLGHGDDWGHT